MEKHHHLSASCLIILRIIVFIIFHRCSIQWMVREKCHYVSLL